MSAADPNPLKLLAELQQQLREQQAVIARLEQQNRDLEAAKRSLYEQLRLAIEGRFGPSTEKYRVEQKDLFFNEPEVELDRDAETVDTPVGPSAGTSRPRRVRGGRLALPPELPRVEVIHDLSDDEKRCHQDGAALHLIGEEISEQLDVVPARLQVIRHIRRKYACRVCEDGVTTAALPPQPLPKSNASPALLAYIAIAKYQDALPLYRQERVFQRLGLDLPRNTLARWMIQLSELILPLMEQLERHLLASPLIHMDETVLQVNAEPDRAACSPSYMWVRRGGHPRGGHPRGGPPPGGPPSQQVVLYDYAPSRSGQVPVRLLGDYRGILLTDGYEGYAQVVRANGLVHAGCWAHARRKFVEAIKVQPKGKAGRADQVVKLIAKLYAVEKQAGAVGAEERLRLRADRSRPLIEELAAWLDKNLPQVVPKSALGRALHYLQGQWPRLTRFLEDGHIPLDNNPAENAIRPFVIGRKNWLFSQTPSGAQASARLYSLIETAKVNGLEPYGYLLEVITRLPAAKTEADIEALLPWNHGAAVATDA